MELNKYQLLYIQTVYDYFRENLQWPTFRQVLRKILPTHPDFRVVEVAKSIEDNQAAHFFQNLDFGVTITLKEIHQLPQARQDLADLLKVIRYSVEKYLTGDKDGVRVRSEEVSQNLHFDETAIRKVFQLLGFTTGIIGSNSISPDYKTWSFEVSDSSAHWAGHPSTKTNCSSPSSPSERSAIRWIQRERAAVLIRLESGRTSSSSCKVNP
jgi:hypothetical protein